MRLLRSNWIDLLCLTAANNLRGYSGAGMHSPQANPFSALQVGPQANQWGMSRLELSSFVWGKPNDDFQYSVNIWLTAQHSFNICSILGNIGKRTLITVMPYCQLFQVVVVCISANLYVGRHGRGTFYIIGC